MSFWEKNFRTDQHSKTNSGQYNNFMFIINAEMCTVYIYSAINKYYLEAIFLLWIRNN